MKKGSEDNLENYLSQRRALVEEALERLIPGEENAPSLLFRAMRYSLFAGGKRLRPILCLAGAEAAGGDPASVLPAACALECIHTYSLIHDDLPAMDDDDLRRGKPTCHKVFGEATAILAGDALLTQAFTLLADPRHMPSLPPLTRVKVIAEIGKAAGPFGMVGGQVMDMAPPEGRGEVSFLDAMHRRKTGAMIRVSVVAGAMLCGGDPMTIKALSSYGERIGLAFQIADDILDVTGDPGELGKGTGGDRRLGKVTYPAVMGLEASRRRMADLVDGALTDLEGLDERAHPLRGIAKFIMERKS